MYVCIYIKRFHFICKISFFFRFFLTPLQKMMPRLKEKISYMTVSRKEVSLAAEDGPPSGAGTHGRLPLVLCKKRRSPDWLF